MGRDKQFWISWLIGVNASAEHYDTYADEILEAIAAERERCCAAMCNSCKQGLAVRLGGTYDNRPTKHYVHLEPMEHDCAADRIRRLSASQSREKEGETK